MKKSGIKNNKSNTEPGEIFTDFPIVRILDNAFEIFLNSILSPET